MLLLQIFEIHVSMGHHLLQMVLNKIETYKQKKTQTNEIENKKKITGCCTHSCARINKKTKKKKEYKKWFILTARSKHFPSCSLVSFDMFQNIKQYDVNTKS